MYMTIMETTKERKARLEEQRRRTACIAYNLGQVVKDDVLGEEALRRLFLKHTCNPVIEQ